MVTFTCQHCNASLKKKVVDNHRFQCKRNLHLTCIDCLKDFYGNQYEGHISCVSESERYGGKNYSASSSENKHAAWMTTIKSLLETSQLSKEERTVLKSASTNPNLPTTKKKFINYFIHLPAYYHKGEFIESVFDLISNEHKKRQEVNNEVKQNPQPSEEGKKEKKRKTISETQEDVETLEPQAKNTNDKQKKKKKNKDKSVEVEDNSVTTNSNSDQGENSKEAVSNGATKKKDKKKKKSVSYDLDESQIERDSLKEALDEAEANTKSSSGDCISTSDQNRVEEETKLSKKEKKKLLKQQKYQAELESIENYQEEKENDPGVDEAAEKKKKSKRNKNIEGNNKGETFEQKRETKISVSEPDGKKLRLEDDEEDTPQEEPVVEKPKKFKWDKMIIQVLRGADDYEMPLKRLSKKVCGEYMLLFGEKENYEDILMMFNKKVVKTQGVRVFKDRAKLIC